jgi:succinyl-CoA synthetase beta subunit
MRLYEFQAKNIFSQYGISIPKGQLASSPEEAVKIIKKFGCSVVIKSQVLLGGRGLAGGIKFADNSKEAYNEANQLLGSLVKMQRVNKILVEKKIAIKQEYFLSITIDFEEKCPVIIVSSSGGVEVETNISISSAIKERIQYPLGLPDFLARRIAKKVGLESKALLFFTFIIKTLYKIFLDYDAILVEINPLAFKEDGSFVALDGKIELDENAAFRHRNLYSELVKSSYISEEKSVSRKSLAENAGIPTYFEQSGQIGILADGAGTGMLTFDLTKDYGGNIETYCELGGRINPSLIETGMEIILSNPKVRVLLINLIGGLNRMDEMAEGITSYILRKEKNPNQEIIVRMSGTLEEEGRRILKAAGIISYDNIYDAIKRTVEIAGAI